MDTLQKGLGWLANLLAFLGVICVIAIALTALNGGLQVFYFQMAGFAVSGLAILFGIICFLMSLKTKFPSGRVGLWLGTLNVAAIYGVTWLLVG